MFSQEMWCENSAGLSFEICSIFFYLKQTSSRTWLLSTSLQEKNRTSLYTFRQTPGPESTPKKRFMLMMVCCFAEFMQHSGCLSTNVCGGQAT